MFRFFKRLFEEEQVDWSDVDRLESRICDIRERIRKAKGPTKPILSVQRTYITPSLQSIKEKSNDLRRSLQKGSAVSQQPEQRHQTQAEIMKAKLLGKNTK